MISTCDMETWSLFVWPGWHAIPRWKSWVLQCAIAKPNQRVIWLNWMEQMVFSLRWTWIRCQGKHEICNYDFTISLFSFNISTSLYMYHIPCQIIICVIVSVRQWIFRTGLPIEPWWVEPHLSRTHSGASSSPQPTVEGADVGTNGKGTGIHRKFQVFCRSFRQWESWSWSIMKYS